MIKMSMKRRIFLFSVVVLLITAHFVLSQNRNSIQNITTDQLEMLEKKDYYVIVSSDTCIHCKKMKPVYDSVVSKLSEYSVYEVDATDLDLTDNFILENEITSIPTVLHFSNSKVVDRITGEKDNIELNNFFGG